MSEGNKRYSAFFRRERNTKKHEMGLVVGTLYYHGQSISNVYSSLFLQCKQKPVARLVQLHTLSSETGENHQEDMENTHQRDDVLYVQLPFARQRIGTGICNQFRKQKNIPFEP